MIIHLLGLSNYLDSTLSNSASSDNSPNEKKNDSDDDSDSTDSNGSANRIKKQNISHLDILATTPRSNGAINDETLSRRKYLAKILDANMNTDRIKNRSLLS